MCTSALLQVTLSMCKDPLLFKNVTLSPPICQDLNYQQTIISNYIALSAEESTSDDACPWSDELPNELLYEVATEL